MAEPKGKRLPRSRSGVSAVKPSPEPLERAESGTNPLARIDDGLNPDHLQRSEDLIYRSIMRGGGEAFGQPFRIGLSTLTSKVVKFFKQQSFFGFETFEKQPPRRWRNKFTRYGAARHFGSYDVKAASRARRKLEKKR